MGLARCGLLGPRDGHHGQGPRAERRIVAGFVDHHVEVPGGAPCEIHDDRHDEVDRVFTVLDVFDLSFYRDEILPGFGRVRFGLPFEADFVAQRTAAVSGCAEDGGAGGDREFEEDARLG